MRISYAAGVLLLVFSSGVLAQPEIHWKTRLYGRGTVIDRQPAANATTDRRHWVVQFAAAPTAADPRDFAASRRSRGESGSRVGICHQR
jgi:hypothetical protein